MTTILIDLEKQKIAADRQANVSFTSGWSRPEVTQKIHPISDTTVITGTGSMDVINHLVEEYAQCNQMPCEIGFKADYTITSSSTIAVVSRLPNKKCIVDFYNVYPKPKPWYSRSKIQVFEIVFNSKHSGGYHTLGSGQEFAAGAYEATGDMTRSIKAASNIDPKSGLGVDIYSLRYKRFLKV